MSEGHRSIYSGTAQHPAAPEDALAMCARLVSNFGAPHRPVSGDPEGQLLGALQPLSCRHCGDDLGLVPTSVTPGQPGPSQPCPICGRNTAHPPPGEEAPEAKKGRKS